MYGVESSNYSVWVSVPKMVRTIVKQ